MPLKTPDPLVQAHRRFSPGLHLGKWLADWSRLATDLVYPPTCAFCGEPSRAREDGALLCETCSSRLALPAGEFCPRCGTTCSPAALVDGRCSECRPKNLAFGGVMTLGLYENDVRSAVLRIKHHQQEPLAMTLGLRLATRLSARPFSQAPDLVAPIPMHWWARLLRGTHTADTLAHSLAAAARIPLASDLLHCLRRLQRQATLTPTERFANVKGAYGVSRGYDIRGATILLVDDVITTGATCDSAARALLKAGAKSVFAIAVARSVGLK